MRVRLRRRVFVGCEGPSERSYSRWLQAQCDRTGLHIHLDTHLAGGGDPLAIVEASISAMRRKERALGRYQLKIVLLDSDKLGRDPRRDALIAPRAARAGVRLLYQEWEHEALLLRHFPRHGDKRPPAGQGERALRRVWRTYRKPADALELNQKLDASALHRAMAVEIELARFLQELGFAPIKKQRRKVRR